MILRSLATKNFRNLVDAEYHFHPQANLFLGDNGQGKTNLLEAIYFAATTKSFRTPRVATMVRLGAQNIFAESTVEEDGISRTLSVGISGSDERRRQLQVNGQKTTLSEFLQVLPVFAYSSSRLEIVRGGPDERRRFLDRGISALRVGYLRELTRYARVLKQRNALLTRISEGSEKKSALDPWDEELVVAASPIVAARAQYTDAIRRAVTPLAEIHAPFLRDLLIDYQPAGLAQDTHITLKSVREMRPRELAAGFTLFGPHRDHLIFSVRGVAAHEILSSGEVKTLTLLLKIAKVQVFQQTVRRSPVFLLDDIDAELDLGVIQRLLGSLLAAGQFFTTSSKESIFRLLAVGPHRRFLVRNGTLTEVPESSA